MIKKTAILALALLLVFCTLFSCAQKPKPIEGEENIRAVIVGALPETDNMACLHTAVWGEDATGITCVTRADGESRRYTLSMPDGRESVYTIVNGTVYLCEKIPSEEGGTPTERKCRRALAEYEKSLVPLAYSTRPLSADFLADVFLSGEESAFLMPDGNTQLLSKNPDAALFASQTGYVFASDKWEAFGILDKSGRLTYLRLSGTAYDSTNTETALFLEYVFSYEGQTLTPPKDADTYEKGEFSLPGLGE